MEVYKIACLEKLWFFSYICVIKLSESFWSLAVSAGVNSQCSCFLCANGSKSWVAWGMWVLLALLCHAGSSTDISTYVIMTPKYKKRPSDIESACRDKAWINRVYTVLALSTCLALLSKLLSVWFICFLVLMWEFSSAACVDSGHIAPSQKDRINHVGNNLWDHWVQPPCARP